MSLRRALSSAPICYAIALFVGLVFVFSLCTVDRTFGLDTYNFGITGDGAQHIIGQRYFIGDHWRWPLLVAKPLRWPDGVSVIFTDSIPLILVPTKLFRSVLPPGFQEIYLWLAICWLIQPLAAVFALRSAGERRFLPALVLAVMSVSVPTMLWRIGHQALCSHFLILFALGCYFRTVHGSSRTAAFAPVALLIIALFIHPYLLAMVAAVLAAAPISLLLNNDRTWKRVALPYVVALGLTAWIAILFGYGGGTPSGGYGTYSMNLLSPFVPWLSSLFPGWTRPADGTGGQYEGYQYLGAGLFLLCTVTAVGFVLRPDWRILRRHAGLVLVLVGLTVFAISNQVYLGPRKIANLGRVPAIFNDFRSSGRFFWPVTYMLLIGSVVFIARRLPRPAAIGIFAAATVLQVADTRQLRAGFWDDFHGKGDWAIDVPALRPILAKSAELTVWPRFECGAPVDRDQAYMNLLVLASEYELRTNTMYTAHIPPHPLCDPLQIVGTPLRPGELRVLLNGAALARLLVPDGANLCRTSGELAICSADPGLLALLPALSPLRTPEIPLGQIMETGKPDGAKPLWLNWTDPAGVASWTDGNAAFLLLRVVPASSEPLRLTLWADALAPAHAATQHVTLLMDHQPVTAWDVPQGHRSELRADLPPRPDPAAPMLLELKIAHPVRPIDVGRGADTREMGLGLYAYEFSAG